METIQISKPELRELIESTVRKTVLESMDNYFEDLQALSSKSYLKDIAEARKEYTTGKSKRFEIENV
jgi:hypothetical protein